MRRERVYKEMKKNVEWTGKVGGLNVAVDMRKLGEFFSGCFFVFLFFLFFFERNEREERRGGRWKNGRQFVCMLRGD